MVELLKKSARLMMEQSKARERVIALNKKSDTEAGLTDEERSELNTAVDRLEGIEPEIRAAVTAEAAEQAALEQEARNKGPETDPETRERNELAAKARMGRYVLAAVSGARLDGAEAELRAALGLGEDAIPTMPMDVAHREREAAKAETRAVTPAPGTVGVNLGMVQPFVFAPSIASRLGIEIRDVPSGTYAIPTISTAPSTAAPVAKGGDADATAGALSVASATPKRVPARLSLSLEDVAAVGTDSFEEALRQALQAKLSDSLDNQIINGDGQAPNLSGLLHQLTDPAAPAANEETFDRWAAIGASVIDGLWAARLGEVAMIWHADAYRQASGVFRGTEGPVSAAAYLAREAMGFYANARMPAAGNDNIADGIAARMGMPGLTRAVVPNWGRVVVDDIYSDSGKGQRHFTVSAIVGDLLLVQSDAYVQLAARIA